MSLLRADNLHYRVDGVDILKAISVELRAGELIGLIGPNGAGKSTLLRLLTGLLEPGGGSVSLAGTALGQVSLPARAKQLGYLPQVARASWPVSVENVVALGRLPHRHWWQPASAEDRQCVEQAMAMTETIAYRNRIVTTLSGGEHTLVMLARIFATGPQLVFADEPVAALDPYHQLHVMELLQRHARASVDSAPKAAVVILHDLGLAARFCDRLYLLNHGELFAEGTPQQVLTDHTIATVYGVKSLVSCSETGVSVTPVARLRDHHP